LEQVHSVIHLIERYRGALLGLACGDAVGCAVEFLPRGRFKPLTDMTGGGKFKLQAGEWTDDTSMAVCLAESLVEKQGFDPKDQMDRYLNWAETGKPGPKPHPIGIGKTVLNSLFRYRRNNDPYAGSNHEYSAGNGALMRLAPVVLAYYPEHASVHEYTKLSTLVTHGAEACIRSSYQLAEVLYHLLSGCPKEAVQSICPDWNGLAEKDDRNINGSGFAPDSLKAAVWSFLTTSSFEQAILTAANLGDDADTTAAICGQIAGACYGINSIPATWLDKLYMRDVITGLADRLYELSPLRH
jgi:ADP-ribosyl-[dinitrogen reductase] hydrolase